MISTHAPREHIVEANGLAHHVLEWDDADSDITVVLLHGFLDLAWSFERVVPKLAPYYHVIAPDLRGHGDTAWIGAGGYYYFHDYIADLARLLPRLTRRRVYLVGHSMGGTAATFYTGTFPERVHKLALLEGVGPPEDSLEGAPERMRKHIHSVDEVCAKRLQPLPSLGAATERLRQAHPRLDPAWAERLAEKATRPAPDGPPGSRLWKHDPLHRTRTPLLFSAAQLKAFIDRIRCPVLLVNGGDSHLSFMHDPARLGLYADATVKTLPAAGHMMQLDQPDALADLLLEFFRV